MASFEKAYEGLLQIPEDGEGSIAEGEIVDYLTRSDVECRQIDSKTEHDDYQNYGVILLHHPLDIVDMVVDDFTDELSCLRVILPLAGTEHVVGLLIVIIGRSPAAYLKTGIEVHQFKDIVIVFIIAIYMFVSGITSCRLDEIAGQSKRVIFIIHLIHIKD